ncbi:MAG: CDP-alcohol phosphatidyltransferase family protein [Polyangiaceae bacterium]|jgi:phosphatidylglycerophosphate synthase/putative flippase GtrA|nr:CDP-alcohol phosphatidyltransferase family protein [Polyangiaceae bacterium]
MGMTQSAMIDAAEPWRSIIIPLAPAAVLTFLITVALISFAARNAIWGAYRDAELEARGATPLLGMWVRLFFSWFMRPVWRMLLVTRIPANAVTTLSVLLASAAGIATAAGNFALGGWIFLIAGVCDYLDGRLARKNGTASPRGAALDSVLDRYSDAAILMGLAWFFRQGWELIAVLVALVGSIMVPYVRARGEGLGASFRNVGLLQRPERVVLLGLSLAFSPVLEALLRDGSEPPAQRLAVAGLILVAVTTHFTALQRLFHVLGSLGANAFGRITEPSRGSLLRIVAAASIATASDFAMVALLVGAGWLSAPAATLLGCAMGALLNFSIHRLWLLQDGSGVAPIPGRFVFVAITSALLNSGAVAVLLMLPDLQDYRIGWWAARAGVFVLWNWPLSRTYVFDEAGATRIADSASVR